MAKAYTIGIDYGTNSVRALVVDCADGREIGTSVFAYPSGDQGVLLDPRDPHLARQNPADYVAGLEASVNGALAAAEKQPGFSRADVIGLGVDTTGSTPIPVDAKSRPLALDPKWRDEPRRPRLALEGPHRRRGGRGHHPDRGRARAAVPRADRRHVLLRVVLVEDLALPEGGARTSSPPPTAGSSWPTSSRPSSPASTIPRRSSAASAPPATRRCTPTPGAACRRRTS